MKICISDSGNECMNYISLSTDNEYIPVRSLGTGYTKKIGDRKVFIYGLNTDIWGRYLTPTITKRISRFCLALDNGLTNWVGVATNIGVSPYYTTYGTLVWIREEDYKPIPLLLLAVKREYLFNIDKENPDASQFCLLVDNKLKNDERHSRIYRNVERIYIRKVEKTMDVVYTNDIMKLCFNLKSMEMPKYKNIPEMLDGFNSINNVVKDTIRKSTDIYDLITTS